MSIIRIVQNCYSDGTLKYDVRQRNWRDGYDEVYKPDGSGVAEFDTFDEAFKFAFPKQDKHNPYIVDSKVLYEDYSDIELL